MSATENESNQATQEPSKKLATQLWDKVYAYSTTDSEDSHKRSWIGNIFRFLAKVVAAAVLASAFAVMGFTYDFKEMLVELYYKERVLANLAAFLMFAAAVYFAAPIVLPILVGLLATNSFVSFGFAVAGCVVAVAAALKISRFLTNTLDTIAHCGGDSRFADCDTTLQEKAKSTRETGLFGTNEAYQVLEGMMRASKAHCSTH